jgi:hypothetical protein
MANQSFDAVQGGNEPGLAKVGNGRRLVHFMVNTYQPVTARNRKALRALLPAAPGAPQKAVEKSLCGLEEARVSVIRVWKDEVWDNTWLALYASSFEGVHAIAEKN